MASLPGESGNLSDQGASTRGQAFRETNSANVATAYSGADLQPAIPFRGLYIGGTGDVQVVDNAGNTVTFKAHPVGYMPVIVTKIVAAGTTATNILGLT